MRASTPERLVGMNGNDEHGSRYLEVDDMSDSDEEEMDVSEDDQPVIVDTVKPKELSPITCPEDESQVTEPPRKKQHTDYKKDGDSLHKWSNPDPYTSLPPVDESRKKRKDVVKLIRKARVAPEKGKDDLNGASEAKEADFISFDFGEAASEVCICYIGLKFLTLSNIL